MLEAISLRLCFGTFVFVVGASGCCVKFFFVHVPGRRVEDGDGFAELMIRCSRRRATSSSSCYIPTCYKTFAVLVVRALLPPLRVDVDVFVLSFFFVLMHVCRTSATSSTASERS